MNIKGALNTFFGGIGIWLYCNGISLAIEPASSVPLSDSSSVSNYKAGAADESYLPIRDNDEVYFLSKRQQQEIAQELFFKIDTLSNDALMIDQNVLNILIGNDHLDILHSSQNLFHLKEQAETIVGSLATEKILCRAQDSSILTKKQQAVQFLLNNEQVYKNILAILKNIKEHESALLSYWREGYFLNKNIKNLLYYSNDSKLVFLNTSPYYHQLRKLSSFVVLGMLGLFTVPLIPALGVYQVKTIIALCLGDINSARFFSFITSSLVLFAFVIKSQFNYFRLLHYILVDIQQRLYAVNKLYLAIKDLFYLIKDHEALKEGMLFYKQLEDFALQPEALSNKLCDLKKFLGKATFEKEKFGIFSNAGNVIVAQANMETAKECFIPPLEAIGELDAYLALVKLIKEQRNSFLN